MEDVRRMPAESVDLEEHRSGGTYLVPFSSARRGACTPGSGDHRSSVISNGEACFLIVDIAAISWVRKKRQKTKRGFEILCSESEREREKKIKIKPASADCVECFKRNAILQKIRATGYFYQLYKA